jgi:tetratricopeptide (TPR) repeat protein
MRKSNNLLAASFGIWVLVTSSIVSAASNHSAALPVDDTTQQIHDRAADSLLHGRFFEALHGFNEVLKLEPFNASAYYNRGNVRYFRREFDLAVQDYTDALKYRPGFAAAAMNRGVAFSNLDRLDEALIDLDKAADLDPSNPDVFFNRAVVHVKRGAMEKALNDYDKIVQLDGSNPDLAAARDRLKALLSRVDEVGVVGRERDRRIIAEIDHARNVEQLLDFANRTCIRLGDDSNGLSALAQADGWTKVSDDQLSAASSPNVKLTGGWTLTNRLGSIAVVQSKPGTASFPLICSITARLGDAHWFEDFATLFSSRFRSPRLVIREREGQRISQQIVVREDDQARVEITLSHAAESKVFTVRTVHEKKAGLISPRLP